MKTPPLRWLRAGRAALIATVAASATLVPVIPASAQANCLTAEYEATSWSTGPAAGGFVAEITITNSCGGPVNGWTLELILPPGHSFTQGWSASWTGTAERLTAVGFDWNRLLNPATSLSIGFVGSWTGAYQDPLSCRINGSPCDGSGSGENEPPVVTLTRPSGGLAGLISPCPFTVSADASDPDGAIDRVEFYVNNTLVGTDRTAPYLVGVTTLPSPRPGSAEWVAFARAYDDGAPQRSTDSPPVTFQIAIGDPVPGTLLACASSLELPAGSAGPIRFGLFPATTGPVTLTVTGDPRITVSPTTVVPSGNLVLATVTAAPGSAGATATITATVGELRPASTSITVS